MLWMLREGGISEERPIQLLVYPWELEGTRLQNALTERSRA